MSAIVLIIVLIYLTVMLFIGWYSSKMIRTNEDFMVAGRRLGPMLMAGTLAATEIGGGSSLGVVEQAYGNWGLGAAWYIITMGIAFVIIAIYAPELREAMVKTVPEFFRKRYGEAPGAVTAVIMLLPLVGLTASQFIASAVLLSVMAGFSYSASVIIVSIVVIAYSVMGGLWSVSLTDFVQMSLILIGMFLAIPFALEAAGGWGGVVAVLPAEKFSLTMNIGWRTIVSLTVMYIASFTVGQEAVVRYYAAKNNKAAIEGSLIAAAINFVYAFVPAILGLIALALVNKGVVDGSQMMVNGAKYALPVIAIQLMPPLITGLLFASLISATMSSADSDLLGAGSIFANDLYRIYIDRSADDKKVLKVTRISMVAVGIFAMVVALTNQGSIIDLLMFSFTLRAGGSFIPYILGHYWKKASWAGAMASLVAGSAGVLLAERGFVSFFSIDPVVFGLLISAFFFVIFTRLFPRREYDA